MKSSERGAGWLMWAIIAIPAAHFCQLDEIIEQHTACNQHKPFIYEYIPDAHLMQTVFYDDYDVPFGSTC